MLPHLPINSFRHKFPSNNNKLKFPSDKVTVITDWMPMNAGLYVGQVTLPRGSPHVFGPGEEVQGFLLGSEVWVFGYQYPVVPHVPESELAKVRAEFEGVRILQDKGNSRKFSKLATGAKDKGAIAG